MTPGNHVLAFYRYPEPGVELFEDDLRTEEAVIHLFDYCQILEAAVFGKGWAYLLETFGARKLYELDRISGWFGAEDFTGWLGMFFYHSLISGYNPQTGSFGTFDPEMGIFVTEAGAMEEPDAIRFESTF